MTTAEWAIFAAGNVPVVVFIGWAFFRTWEDFLDALLFWITPDFISLFRGRLAADWWATFKLSFFIMASFLAMAAEMYLIELLSGYLRK